MLKDPLEKKKKDKVQNEEEEGDKVYAENKVFVRSLTAPIKPIAPEKKYYFIPFGSDKPCTHIKFPFEDQRRRHYNFSMLKKIYSILVTLSSKNSMYLLLRYLVSCMFLE